MTTQIERAWKSRISWSRRLASGATLLGMISLLLALRVGGVEVLTQHYNNYRTGANLAEVLLAPPNVNSALFGKLFSKAVDGYVYAEPLYVSGLTISGGTHNVVFVCTESNSVYAFDADSGGAPFWHVNLGTPPTSSQIGCSDITPQYGITGTPVIDLSNNTFYVDAKTISGSTYAHKLHALDLSTSSEKFGGPVTISATLSGVTFSAQYQHQRPGLLLLNGVVYLAFGSHCDHNTYHGWLLGYNETNLQQVAVFDTTPNGSQGAIWSCGMAPSADANGNIYVMTGNGTFDANTGGADYAQSFLKLSTTNGLGLVDWFAPWNAVSLSMGDQDIGSGGPVLLPGTHLLIGLGKPGLLYLVDQNNLGHFANGTSDTNIVQEFAATPQTDTIGQSPVYWNGPANQFIFIACGNGQTKAFNFTGATIQTNPLATGSVTQSDRSGGLSLSANGATNGILWLTDNSSGGTLRAYNAARMPIELWDSQQDAARDSLGGYVKFCSPTVANGKVYAVITNGLVVYGSFATPSFFLSANPGSQTVNAGGAGAAYSVSVMFTNAFANTVSLSASGLPAGVTASFNPVSLTGSGTSTLSVTASFSSPQGGYPLAISGNAGSLTNSTNVTLVVSGPPAPTISRVSLAGANLVLSGTNGPSGGTFNLLASTNLAMPLTNWTPAATGAFDTNGNFLLTNPVTPTSRQRFFRLQVP